MKAIINKQTIMDGKLTGEEINILRILLSIMGVPLACEVQALVISLAGAARGKMREHARRRRSDSMVLPAKSFYFFLRTFSRLVLVASI